ncbi:hypothetical protein BT96DRAFT_998393 [Gymnopus androsaceus JB14]|uniref:Ubiquitin 3 binding protein But2 C-terminal domain-containing protein n=1 Tax=Gymnopus androsaceus JB14 TaxID=1447944 RepID=A0A6A4HAD1_9AGAR|nr:hypothetical protein BT96DRAFT_998393 [Gymnopus androsaceus JB14]
MYSSQKYESIPQSDDVISNATLYGGFYERVSELFNHYATTLLWLFSAVNLSIGLLIVARLYNDSPLLYNVHKLESRRPYIGFDSIYSNRSFLTTTYPPIHNQPRVLAPVYANEPDKVAPVWANRHLTADGYVPIAERRLFVTPEVSTIVQFHIQDYGMEKCSVTLEVPAFNASDRYAAIWGKDVALDIWALEGESKVDFQKLSWHTKPKRKNHIGKITSPSYNSTQELPTFPCVSGTYLTFEVTCASLDCHVDVMRAKWPEGSFYIVQQQSI